MVHHRDAVMASYGCQRVSKQICFALVWEEDMTMGLNDDWLVLVVMYALHVGDDVENLRWLNVLEFWWSTNCPDRRKLELSRISKFASLE